MKSSKLRPKRSVGESICFQVCMRFQDGGNYCKTLETLILTTLLLKRGQCSSFDGLTVLEKLSINSSNNTGQSYQVLVKFGCRGSKLAALPSKCLNRWTRMAAARSASRSSRASSPTKPTSLEVRIFCVDFQFWFRRLFCRGIPACFLLYIFEGFFVRRFLHMRLLCSYLLM